MSDPSHVIRPPNALRMKVGGGFGINADAVARAEEALKAMAAQFDQWLKDEIVKLDAAQGRIREEGYTPETAENLYFRAHDLKGLGTTYEYPLVTRIAGSLCRLLDDAGGPVEITVSAQKIRFQLGEASLTSKVIDGAFPDYLRVIPRGNDKQADIDNALFAKAVDRVATISAEKSRSVKLAFDNDRVKLTVRNMEAGQAEEEVEIGYSDEPFEIGFNARYLLDVAGQITGENAAFRFADPASPTLVLDPGDPGVQYVLMPLRV